MSLVKVMLLSHFFVKKIKAGNESCVLLGNGPSLTGFLEEGETFLKGKSTFCVNFFCRTAQYTSIRPNYYVFVSLEYFEKGEIESWNVDRQHTLETIVTKTDWPMTLLVPSKAKKSKEWQKIISANPNITIAYFNTTPIEGLQFIDHWLFRNGLGMPRPHNVLIPSLMVALNAGYKKIYVTGADHSWTKEIHVSEENEVLLRQKHFYGKQTEKEKINKNTDRPQPMYVGGSTRKRRLHEVLMKFVHSFGAYWQLRAYADAINVKILNITPGSFIDAFERLDFKKEGKSKN